MNKAERVKDTTERFLKALDYYEHERFGFEKSILERLEENKEFYTGVGQWPKHIKLQLQSEYRPALVINRCAPIANMISGFEIQNRFEMKPYPFESEDAERALIMEYVLKHLHRGYKDNFLNSEGFLKSIVSSEANWEFSIDIGDDGMPIIEKRLLPTGSVMWDPLSIEYDRSDAMYCFQNSWIGVDELFELRPALVEGKNLETRNEEDDFNHITFRSKYDDYRYGGKQNAALFKKSKQEIRLIRCWRKHYEREYVVVDRMNPGNTRKMDEKEIKEIDIENPTLDIRPRMKPRFSYHMVSGEEELARIDNIHLTRIPVVPLYCFFLEGTYFSVIDLAKDRQMQINKTDSVMHDYLSRLPKLAAMAEEGAFINEQDRDRFDRARVGDSFVFADGALREGKVFFPDIRGLEIISYYNKLKDAMSQEMKETTGGHDVLQGIKPKGAQSGVAFDILRSQGLTIIEPIMNNYERSKNVMAELECELVQKFFPPAKIERILGGVAARYKDARFTEIWDVARDNEEERAKLFDAMMSTKYDIMMDRGLNSVTVQHANAMQFRDLMANGFPVPPELVIENVPISQDWKDLWKQYVKQMQGMAGPGAGD